MFDFESYYLWYKTIHVISIISWMAAMFYLPRLFVYHTRADIGSDMDSTFKVMERKLLKLIMNPAMISSYIFGLLTAHIYGWSALGIWFHIKFTAVLGLTFLHAFLARQVRAFASGTNKYSEKFYRIINEVPVLLMVIAVIMVIIKPFE